MKVFLFDRILKNYSKIFYNIGLSIVLDSLGIESEGVSSEFTDVSADLTISIEPGQVLVFVGLFFVVDSGERVKGSGDLEHHTHLILEELLGVAIVVKAELGEVVELLFDIAVVIK